MANAEVDSIIARIAAKFAAMSNELERTQSELESTRAELRRLRGLEPGRNEPNTELTAGDWSRLMDPDRAGGLRPD